MNCLNENARRAGWKIAFCGCPDCAGDLYAGRKKPERLTFHKGIDYAVVMRDRDSTETAICHLYGQDRDVTRFGHLFAASPAMAEAGRRCLQALAVNGAPNCEAAKEMRAALALAGVTE